MSALDDALDDLATAVVAQKRAHEDVHEAALYALQQGASLAAVGARLGISRQAARQRYGGVVA